MAPTALASQQPKKTKRGPRLFQAEKLTAWRVGVRLESALPHAYQAEQRRSPGDGTHLGPKPLIRRVHWHDFWSGPLGSQRRFGLRWLPSVVVNVETLDEVLATVCRVQ